MSIECVHVGNYYTFPYSFSQQLCTMYGVDEYGSALPSHKISITLHFLPDFTGMSTCAGLNLFIKMSLLHH